MSDIKPFLVNPPLHPADEESLPIGFQPYVSPLIDSGTCIHPTINYTPQFPQLSDEDLELLQEYAKSDATRLIEHFGPKLQEYQSALERQVKAVEEISQHAKEHADQALKQAIISKEKLALAKEQVESLSSISYDAKSQADTARKELELMRVELRITKEATESAEKDAAFS